METALTLVFFIGLAGWAYQQGKQKGSRQGFRAGWQKSRRRKTRQR